MTNTTYTTRQLNKMRKDYKALEKYFEKKLSVLDWGHLNNLINIHIELQTYTNQ